MGLVGYSDSEGSGDESSPPPSTARKGGAASTSKAGFQKVVDRAHPSKIKVSLPPTSTSDARHTTEETEGPPAKKVKLGGGGGGGLSGFNAMLPTPKRAAAIDPAASKAGLRRGVSLKTGAAPAFSREPAHTSGPDSQAAEEKEQTRRDLPSYGENMMETAGQESGPEGSTKEPELKGKVTMFKPLSVARKPQKPKKKAEASTAQLTTAASSSEATAVPPPTVKPKAKISLFSSYSDTDHYTDPVSSTSAYQPTLYQPEQVPDTADDQAIQQPAAISTPALAAGQSLDRVAADLDLSDAARRQLFGRAGKGAGVKVMTFNTDAEYAANEMFRNTADQQEVRNPVRAIQPGKHNLRQLVNAAVGQKDALEDSFAAGRRNRQEAGSKYGW